MNGLSMCKVILGATGSLVNFHGLPRTCGSLDQLELDKADFK